MFKIDTRFLIKTLGLQSNSKHYQEALDFISEEISSIKDVIFSIDDCNNIIVTKGKTELYPCFVCHYDTVHATTESKRIKQIRDCLYAFDEKEVEQIGIGGDDLVGVYMCIQLLKDVSDIKVVFFSDEEVGRVGSTNIDLTFFKDCSYIIQIDRRGNSDAIDVIFGVSLMNDTFKKQCTTVLNKYKYKFTAGITTDVYSLKIRGVKLSCMNLSCGYYRPHDSTEYVNITDINNTYNLVLDLMDKLKTGPYIHEYIYKKHLNKSDYDVPWNLSDQALILISTPTYSLKPNPDIIGTYRTYGPSWGAKVWIDDIYYFDLFTPGIVNAKNNRRITFRDFQINPTPEIETLFNKIRTTINNEVYIYSAFFNLWGKEKDMELISRNKTKERFYIPKSILPVWKETGLFV